MNCLNAFTTSWRASLRCQIPFSIPILYDAFFIDLCPSGLCTACFILLFPRKEYHVVRYIIYNYTITKGGDFYFHIYCFLNGDSTSSFWGCSGLLSDSTLCHTFPVKSTLTLSFQDRLQQKISLPHSSLCAGIGKYGG